MSKITFVIDDDQIHQKITEIKLKKLQLGIVCVPFMEAEAAISRLLELKESSDQLPEIILLDVNMPVMDGWDFLNEFSTISSQIKKSIKIYIVTSSVDLRDREKSESYNSVSGYITKPLEDEILKEIFS